MPDLLHDRLATRPDGLSTYTVCQLYRLAAEDPEEAMPPV